MTPRRGAAARAAAAFTALLVVLALAGCAAGGEIHVDERHFLERAETQSARGFVVEGAALGREESLAHFGVPLNDVNVQPVWLRITNQRDEPYWIYPIAIDQDYFPTFEVARRLAGLHAETEEELYFRLKAFHINLFIPPRSTASGFIYAHADEGMKAFRVELHGPREVQSYSFVVPVPGLPTDYFEADEDGLIGSAQDLGEDGLRDWLEASLDCCTANAEGASGDPLNVVLVGSLDQIRRALVSRHWDAAAPVTGASLWRMMTAFAFGSRYRYAPISSLYVFEREHDLAFQKARAVIDERNHMRLWLAPVTFRGQSVWVGQISRDVGVKLSRRLWPPTTHIIDPDVDDARFYLLQDLLAARAIERVGYVRGLGLTSIVAPGYNAEGDPYFSDGLRGVFFLSARPTPPSRVDVLDWRLPPIMEPYRADYVLRPR